MFRNTMICKEQKPNTTAQWHLELLIIISHNQSGLNQFESPGWVSGVKTTESCQACHVFTQVFTFWLRSEMTVDDKWSCCKAVFFKMTCHDVAADPWPLLVWSDIRPADSTDGWCPRRRRSAAVHLAFVFVRNSWYVHYPLEAVDLNVWRN